MVTSPGGERVRGADDIRKRHATLEPRLVELRIRNRHRPHSLVLNASWY
jgi:hypothetical protein